MAWNDKARAASLEKRRQRKRLAVQQERDKRVAEKTHAVTPEVQQARLQKIAEAKLALQEREAQKWVQRRRRLHAPITEADKARREQAAFAKLMKERGYAPGLGFKPPKIDDDIAPGRTMLDEEFRHDELIRELAGKGERIGVSTRLRKLPKEAYSRKIKMTPQEEAEFNARLHRYDEPRRVPPPVRPKALPAYTGRRKSADDVDSISKSKLRKILTRIPKLGARKK